MNDLEFVSRLCRKDKRSWEQFVDRYSRLIYSSIHAVLKLKGLSGIGQETIDDLFQEIFLILAQDNFRKLATYKAKNGCRLSSWLRQVTVNHVLDFTRRQKPLLSLDAPNEEGGSLSDTIKHDGPPAKEQLLDKEKLQNLSECIEILSDEDKYFLRLHIDQGFSLEELKVAMRISRGAVDMRKSRILNRLRDCFSSKGYPLDFPGSTV
ncbi:MAG: sigma-70 family RNA polymerase sigma factor [Candidatus Omnitrophica bacterium]|nr:sigma-70 family RNA polymerase sigma factor [Candidatus Omnitrophota bacterium]